MQEGGLCNSHKQKTGEFYVKCEGSETLILSSGRPVRVVQWLILKFREQVSRYHVVVVFLPLIKYNSLIIIMKIKNRKTESVHSLFM